MERLGGGGGDLEMDILRSFFARCFPAKKTRKMQRSELDQAKITVELTTVGVGEAKACSRHEKERGYSPRDKD